MRRSASTSRGVEVEAAEVRGREPAVDPAAERPLDRLRLLGDLLVHVVGVAALVVRRLRHRRRGGPFLRRLGVRVNVRKPSAAERRHLAVVQVDDLVGVADQRGRRRRRRTSPRRRCRARTGLPLRATTIRSGWRAVDDGDPVGALDEAQRGADGFLQVRASGWAAIRWASTSVSVSELNTTPSASSRGPQLRGVLDDPVVDDRDRAGAVHVRVGVGVARLRRGSPSGCGRCRRCRASRFGMPRPPGRRPGPAACDPQAAAARGRRRPPSRSRGTPAAQAPRAGRGPRPPPM